MKLCDFPNNTLAGSDSANVFKRHLTNSDFGNVHKKKQFFLAISIHERH